MLRTLASTAARALLSSPSSSAAAAVGVSSSGLASTSLRTLTSSPALRGLDELFEPPLKEGETRTAGV